MIRSIRRSGLVIVALVAVLALAGLVAACGSNATVATTVAGNTTSTSETGTTIVEGGKSLAEYKAEIPDLEKAVAADPTDLTSLEKLGVAHYQLGEYQEAADAYLKILAIQEDAFIRNALGNVYRDWGKKDLAKAAYRQAMKDDPTLKYPYTNLARVLTEEGDTAGALEVLKEGLKHVAASDQKSLQAAEQEVTSTTTTT